MDQFDVIPDMDGMGFPYLSDSTLLGGRVEKLPVGQQPDENPPDGVRGLGDLLSALRAPTRPGELDGEATAVAVFSAAKEKAAAQEKTLVNEKAQAKEKTTSVRRLSSHLGPRVGAATAVGLLAFSGVAAAAVAGSLPAPLQSFVHARIAAIAGPATTGPVTTGTGAVGTATGHTGATTPGPSALPTRPPVAVSTRPSASSGVGPSAGGPSTAGLCHAFADATGSSSTSDQSAAARSLQAAATSAEQTVNELCAPYLSHGQPSTKPNGKPAAATPAPTQHGHGSHPTQGPAHGNVKH